jgi:DNA-directed RNA polymerase subunit RPC12/RpoP
MRKIAIYNLFIYQCTQCHRVIWHNDMKDIHISNINFCPRCGHKLNKNGKLEDLTGDENE